MRVEIFDPTEDDDMELAWRQDIAVANGYSSLEGYEAAHREAEMEEEENG